MSMWTYVTKVPNKTIFADIAEYKRLCERVANARRVYNISRARLTVDNAKGCIYIRLYDVPDFGRDNDSGVFVCQEFCEHFTYTDSCNKSQCKYYQNNVAEAIEDKEYIEAVNKVTESDSGTKVLRDKPVAAKKAQSRNTHVYVRDPMVAANALCNADYKCEVCAEHETFIRKSNGKPYTEPHHLVPIKYQSRFGVSLDVENNIVSLCSNCHNRIHYGADADRLLELLYTQRKEELEKAGINLSIDELKNLYK